MLIEAERSKNRLGIDGKDLAGALAGIEGEQDGHQATHDVGIRIALKPHDGIRTFAALGKEPDLANAALHPVRVVTRLIRKRWQRFTEFDDIAVAILPIIEEGKVVANGLDRRRHRLDI